MNNTPAEIVRQLLISPPFSVYTDPASALALPLFVSELPDGEGISDDAGCVYDTEGRILRRLLASGVSLVSYGISIMHRSRDYNGGFALLDGLARRLGKVHKQGVTIGSNSYRIDTLQRTSNVISIGQDPRRRSLVSANFLVLLLDDAG